MSVERLEFEKVMDRETYGERVASIRDTAFKENRVMWAVVQLGPQWGDRELGPGSDSWAIIAITEHEALAKALVNLLKPAPNFVGVTRHVLPVPILGNGPL